MMCMPVMGMRALEPEEKTGMRNRRAVNSTVASS
ncbi:hypothetical protein Thi970DRAFT_01437 [Thiorhodovibrio frisius]|uniref:Uncharacterized protein n=1 Tax=Thiorhodovibrio frisius TaxID=631362 RepID=H8Z0E6_9GAMM|nr:hypothetical protein Thi970DRAFT_01437 [Thiorhodovibrio frisius]WPL23823.1 hypothetical protein Thiofri_04027 [Thiorhodovibrio frisius]